MLWLIQTLFQNIFQTFLSLSDLARLHRRFFVVFYLIFAMFFSHKAGKTFIPLLLFLFSWFHALFHAFKGNFRTFLNLGFLLIQCYFSENWSLGFVGILLYTWFLLVNSINLGFCEKLKILGFILNLIWGFCSIRLKLMKLACWFDEIDHSKLFSNLCNDQLVNLFKKLTGGFYFY